MIVPEHVGNIHVNYRMNYIDEPHARPIGGVVAYTRSFAGLDGAD